MGTAFFMVDSYAVVPGSFSIENLDTPYYKFDYNTSILELFPPLPADISSLEICYRRSFFIPTKRYEKIHFTEEDGFTLTRPIDFKEKNEDKYLSDVVDLGGINYSGTFGRGVTAGNNQGMSMNSNLNLQFSGYVTDSIKVTAAITDNSIPFQPEGNTQRLQEFDQVFMKFEKNKQMVMLGDHEIFRPEGYFLNFYKRAQGIYHKGTWIDNEKVQLKTTEGISVAKGKFNRNTISPKDGNQGPYRLSTQEANLFFVVIANSERIYIDGELLRRGENMDYVIDYNTAEITFMPKRPINKDLRIIAEFESLDRNYVNPLIVQSTEITLKKKFKSYFNFYQNQDVGNQPINVDLTDADKAYLASIGDSIQYAYIPNESAVAFDRERILYRKIDTIVNGQLFTDIYIRNTDPTVTSYQVGFSYTGPFTGDYTLGGDQTNGKVYVWVAPVDGQSQGEYSAVQRLVTPKKQQMMNLGAAYDISEEQQLAAEVSLTNNDPNRFSDIGDDDHQGLGWAVDYNAHFKLHKTDSIKSKKKRGILIKAHVENLDDKFQPVVRYRNPEFERDWGGTNQADYSSAKEWLTKISTAYQTHVMQINLQNETYSRDTNFSGMRNTLSAYFRDKGWNLSTNSSLMTANRIGDVQQYFRPKFNAVKSWSDFHQLSLSAGWQREHNEIKTDQDSLELSSYSFDILETEISMGEPSSISGRFKLLQRKNRKAEREGFIDQDLANNFTMDLNIRRLKNQNLTFTGTYRQLTTYLPDSSVSTYLSSTSIGRLQYSGLLFKKMINQSLNYEIGTGQEQKNTYFYTEVAAGQGQYYWNDYNGDSIQQLNEFEIALYQDQAKYIRILSPTNEFVNARFLNFNYSLTINPTSLIKKPKNTFQKIINNFSTMTSIQVSNKVLDDQTLDIYNPLFRPDEDTSLVFANNTINNLIYYNKNNSEWGLTYNYRTNTSHQILNFGLESRQKKENIFSTRLKLSSSINWKNDLNFIEDRSHTYAEAFSNRNYNLEGHSFTSTLNYNKGTSFRSSLSGQYRNSDNTSGTEYMNSISLSLDGRYNLSNKSNMLLKFTMDRIESDAIPNTTLGYVMLSGLVPGTNYLWNINYSQKVFNNLEMLIEYNGRKPAESKIIHVGNFTMRAVF